MIGYLKGKVIWQNENNLIIEVNNIGYQVEIPVMKNYKSNDIVEFYIHTYVKEDKLELYGFQSAEEKELFMILLGVSGIGPKAAINIISTLSYDSFVKAILTENVPVLKQISGIGPKTAQRLILDLKNKLEKLKLSLDSDINLNSNNQELYDALLSLGYTNKEIDKTLSKITFDAEVNLEDKIKEVLSYIAKER